METWCELASVSALAPGAYVPAAAQLHSYREMQGDFDCNTRTPHRGSVYDLGFPKGKNTRLGCGRLAHNIHGFRAVSKNTDTDIEY